VKTHILTAISLLLLLVTAGEFLLLRVDVTYIQSGESFLYWLYVERTTRAPLALGFVILIGIWILIRGMYTPLRSIHPLAVIFASSACCIFSVLMPLTSVTAGGHHLQTVTTPQSTWHLYYQLQGIGVSECSYVAVRCDRTGWLCQAVDRWQFGSICPGASAPIALSSTDGHVYISVNSEQIQLDSE
jgi:hypothetical protein